jgi:hypothetical protein
LNGGIRDHRSGFFGHQSRASARETSTEKNGTDAGGSQRFDEASFMHARSLGSKFE